MKASGSRSREHAKTKGLVMAILLNKEREYQSIDVAMSTSISVG
jgi:hypothetical protein